MRANPEIDTLRQNRRIPRITCTLVLALLGATIALLPASAQEATPAPITCDVPPRPVTFIADLIAAPEPELTQTPVSDVPDGTDVTDPQVRSEVVSVVETLIVCVNQGDLLRSFSLFD